MSPDVEPLPARSSTTQDAYALLRAAIISGKLRPDERLRENQLAAQLGVSRTPVREALLLLETDGLVRSTLNRGTVVRRILPTEIRDTYDVRVILESRAAALAARRISPGEIDHLQRLQDEMEARNEAVMRPRELIADLTELNAEFHTVLVNAAGNPVLGRLANTLIQTPLYARAYYSLDHDSRQVSLDAHKRMIALLKTRDADACEEHWRDHIQHARDHLVGYVDAAGDTELPGVHGIDGEARNSV